MFDPSPYGDLPYYAPKPKVTIGIIIANVVGFLLSGLLPFTLQWREFLVVMSLSKDYAIESLWLWQFITYGFIFDISWSLIIFILFMYMLYVFGREVEMVMGGGKLLAIYLGCQAAGGFAHVVYQYLFHSSLAANGGQFPGALAVICTSAFMWPSRTIRLFFIIPITMILACIIMVGINVFYALVYLNTGAAAVACIGAAAASFIWFKTGPMFERIVNRIEQSSLRKRSLMADRTRKEVDRILEKISREGMSSLSRSEVKLLKKASRMFTRKQ
jgi:membrane associated rhomboid family serine protease